MSSLNHGHIGTSVSCGIREEKEHRIKSEENSMAMK